LSLGSPPPMHTPSPQSLFQLLTCVRPACDVDHRGTKALQWLRFRGSLPGANSAAVPRPLAPLELARPHTATPWRFQGHWRVSLQSVLPARTGQCGVHGSWVMRDFWKYSPSSPATKNPFLRQGEVIQEIDLYSREVPCWQRYCRHSPSYETLLDNSEPWSSSRKCQ